MALTLFVYINQRNAEDVSPAARNPVMKHLKLLCVLLFAAFSPAGTVSAATATLFVGQSYQTEISATGYHYLSIESVSSTNPSVSVTKMGLIVRATVNAYFAGEADVTIRLRYQFYAGQDYQYRDQSFTIACNDTQISISTTGVTMKVGETKQLSFSFNSPTYMSPSISWSTSDVSIVEVSSSGLLSAKKEGNATIYAHSNLGSNTASCNVTVSEIEGGSGDGTSVGAGDRNWYSASSNEFHISKSEEFVGLMSMVAEGNTFSGKTIYLDDDIDFISLNWTTPVGVNDVRPFSGTFDGQNHNINYKSIFTTNTAGYDAYYGLFGYVNGTLRNLSTSGNIEITASSDNTSIHIGGIVGEIASGKSVNNCCNEVSIEYKCSTAHTSFAYLGGIAGYNSRGSFSNCINKGAVIDRTNRAGNSQYNNHFLGGICGASDGADIIYCFNSGKIECGPDDSYNSQDNITAIVGGLAGVMTSYSECLYSGNIGSVFGTAKVVKLGGIAGVIHRDVRVIDCYVASTMIGDWYNKASSTSHIGLLGGDTSSSATYSSNYVASDILKFNLKNGRSADESFSIDDMKTIGFVNILNSYGSDSHYIGGDGLFPIPQPSVFMPQSYQTIILSVTCSSALIESNVDAILGDMVSSCGFLIRQDDGKEYYRQCQSGSFQLELNDLIPNRCYYVRWYAKDVNNKEYYGYETNFRTKPINPTTIPAPKCSVFGTQLRGESYFMGAAKYGFFIQKANQDDNGFYQWSNTDDVGLYEALINGLEGNTLYNYCAVIEADGIIHEGNNCQFMTKSIAISDPSNFTDDNVLLNGEIGVEVSSAWFEIRADSWPSVIESERVLVENVNVGIVSVQSPALQLNETYRYRIVVENGGDAIHGDWVEFFFEGDSGVDEACADRMDDTAQVIVYDLSGRLVFSGLWSNVNLEPGIYIVRQGAKIFKTKL